jgi:hypothetical protein
MPKENPITKSSIKSTYQNLPNNISRRYTKGQTYAT